MDEKSYAEGYFEGEAASAAGSCVEGQLCMLPVSELVFAHIEGAVVDETQENVAVTCPELILLEAHGL
jgi:hypothetical protein